MKRIYNILLGFTITFGKGVFGLFIISMIFDKSYMNYDNTMFIMIMCLAGWILGLIYNSNLNMIVRAISHSGLLYLIGIYSFYKLYGELSLIKYFLIGTIIYWIGYLICYLAGYYYYKKMDADLNDTVSYLKKFEDVFSK